MTGKHTLFDIAYDNLYVAKWIYQMPVYGIATFNFVAYHIEQTVETGLKYILEMSGCDCAYIHDIERLLQLMTEIGISSSMSSELENTLLISSATLTTWGSRGSWDKNWFVSEQNVEYGFKLANWLLSEIATWDSLEYQPLNLSEEVVS